MPTLLTTTTGLSTRRLILLSITMAVCWASVATLIAGSIWVDASVYLLIVVGGALLLVAFWNRPRFTFVTWLITILMVPVWIGIEIYATVPLYSVIATMAIIANISHSGFRITKYDVYFAVFLVITLAAVLLVGSSPASWAHIVLRWAIPFVAVRVLVPLTGIRFAVNAIAILFGLVAGLAVLEYLLAWHPFTGWSTSVTEYSAWHGIQVRNGVDRSEWAFGHSIALGGSLALSIPFISASSYRFAVKFAMLLLVFAAVVGTASRGALVAACFTGALCGLYTARKPILRAAALILAIAVALLAVFPFMPIFRNWARGDSSEERGSFEHRNYLYSTYLSKIRLFGDSPTYAADNSIDSTFLWVGLSFGLIALIVAVYPFVILVARVVTGQATIAEIALVGHLPLFATVALITQYVTIVFIVAGIAVQMKLLSDQARRNPRATSIQKASVEARLPA